MADIFKSDKIGVYISGEVNKPGYVTMPKGKTLEYALNKAQGITKEADINSIDIKQELKNGEKIVVPKKKIDIEKDEYAEENEMYNKININKAGIEELKTLNGIGEKTAQRIVEYRTNKKFDSIEEILEVNGIGAGKFEKIKDNITI